MSHDYDNVAYWRGLHQQFRGTLRSVGWPTLSEAFNRLKYESEAESILGIFSAVSEALLVRGRSTISLLEIGVGTGYWTSLFSGYLQAKDCDVDITCLDVSADALELAKEVCPGAALVQGDLKAVATDRYLKKYDVVTAISVLHHLVRVDDFLNGLRFAARSVAEGGYILYYDPILTMHYSPFDVIEWRTYSGNGMPRRLALLDDVLGREGFERIAMTPGVSFVLNGAIEAPNRLAYRASALIWSVLSGWVYGSDARTRMISRALMRVDRALKRLGWSLSATVGAGRRGCVGSWGPQGRVRMEKAQVGRMGPGVARRLRVCIIASWYPTVDVPVGGVFVQEQAQELSGEHDVAVIAPHAVRWRDSGLMRAKAAGSWEADGRVAVFRERWRAPLPRIGPPGTYWSFFCAVKRSFAKLLAGWGRPDILHAHVVLPGGLAAVRLGRSEQIPVVLTEHTSPFTAHLRTRIDKRLVRYTLKNCDRVITVSPSLMRQVRLFAPEVAVDVLGNLVRTRFFKPTGEERVNLHGGNTKFLMIGLLSEQKGGAYLLAAARALLDHGVSGFEVIIGGDGPALSTLQQSAVSLGLGNRCRFVGALSRKQVRDEMQQCDVFVLPSMHETFGIVVGEAMACGKPVIATRCGGPEFVVTPTTGVLVEVGNADALAEAMERFIGGRVRFDAGHIRESVVERFGEDAFLRNVSQLYGDVFSCRRETPLRQ
jgi:glycosyltransferase involved in cell wall biosynthesis/SAM-dependent methyltransferase